MPESNVITLPESGVKPQSVYEQEEGVVRLNPSPVRSGGRVKELFYVGAYDAGGQNARVVVAKMDGTEVATNKRSIENIVGSDLPQVVGDLLEKTVADAEEKENLGIGIVSFAGSQAGTIDRDKGIIVFSPNVRKCRNIEIGKYLTDRFGFSFWLENDADAAGYGTLKKDPQAKGMKHIIYIVMGADIGGGIIINGEIYSGVGGGGEVGHMIVKPNGGLCNCRKRGCWEAYCSGTGIARMGCDLRFVSSIRSATGLAPYDKLKAEHVFTAYNAGCADAKEIINQVGDYNAIALSNLINVLRPEAVFIGESVAVNNPIILEMLRERVPPLLMPGVRETKIYVTKVENPGLQGAIYLAIDRYRKR